MNSLKDITIIDSHFHIWDRELLELEWIKGTALDRDFSFEDYESEYEGLNFGGGVFVELDSINKQKERDYIINLARQKSKMLGFVLNPFCENYICENHGKNHKKLCGFREVLHTEKGKINDKDFRTRLKENLRSLENPLFEICVNEEDLQSVLHLIKDIDAENIKCGFVLNHFGNAKAQNHYIKELGKLENVVMKLSAKDCFSKDTTQTDIESLISLALESFGEKRLLFGSNYPVSNISPKEWATRVFDSLQNLNVSLEGIKDIFERNAMRIYHLKPATRRFGQIIKVKPEKFELYKKLHANAWSGVLDTLERANIRNYSIYHYSDFLFAYFEYVGEDFKADMQKIAQSNITREWWKLTDSCQIPFKEVKEGMWLDMCEVFHLD